jgi:preprotein translocase subunit SecE
VAESERLSEGGEHSERRRPIDEMPSAGEVVKHSESAIVRLGGFLRGSWRELHRVVWPTRPQVMQATGVVLGFVIVAGIFLGVADLLSSKLMNLILK